MTNYTYTEAVQIFTDRAKQMHEAYFRDWLNDDGLIIYMTAREVEESAIFVSGKDEMADMLDATAESIEKGFDYYKVNKAKLVHEIRLAAKGFRKCVQ